NSVRVYLKPYTRYLARSAQDPTRESSLFDQSPRSGGTSVLAGVRSHIKRYRDGDRPIQLGTLLSNDGRLLMNV
ncbi:MAG TPA: hypothetical protein VF898_09540, partial [Chloroflexota bacterium]